MCNRPAATHPAVSNGCSSTVQAPHSLRLRSSTPSSPTYDARPRSVDTRLRRAARRPGRSEDLPRTTVRGRRYLRGVVRQRVAGMDVVLLRGAARTGRPHPAVAGRIRRQRRRGTATGPRHRCLRRGGSFRRRRPHRRRGTTRAARRTRPTRLGGARTDQRRSRQSRPRGRRRCTCRGRAGVARRVPVGGTTARERARTRRRCTLGDRS